MVSRPEVFLSATPVELDAYREVVRKALHEMGARVVEHSDYTVAYGPLQGVLYQEIHRCEVVIHLVGRQYGLEPSERTLGAPPRSFTHYEFDVARSLGKPTFCFLTTPETRVASLPPEDEEKRTLQREHRSALAQSGQPCQTFVDAEDLAAKVRALRQTIMVRRQLVRLPRKPMGERLFGRRQLMETLRAQVQNGGLHVLHLPADDLVSAGTGRTTLAVELGWELFQEGRFSYVIALPGGSRADLEVALAALSRSDALGLLPDEVAGHRIRLESVLQWFRREENSGRWLLILDAVENVANWIRVKALLEKMGEGTVLVTSRIRHWDDARAIAVGPWGPETAHDYLLERTLPGKTPSRSNVAAADWLAEGLHRLPLALEILAAYLIDSKQTPAVFASLLSEAAPGGLSPSTGLTPVGLRALIERVMAHLDAFTHALLVQIVCLAPEPATIPLPIFEQRGDWAQIRVSLMRLHALALIGMDDSGRSISIHRTICENIRELISEAEHTEALGAALSNVDAALLRVQGSGAPLREALVPHCRSLLEQLYGHSIESHAASLVQIYARWLQDNGRAAEADPYFRWALSIEEQRRGGKHPEVAQRLRDLVSVLRTRGRLREAIPFARRALEMTRELSGLEHPDVVGDLYNLAGCLRGVNEFPEAEELCRRALQIEERQTNPNHPRVAVALHRLAAQVEAAGRLIEADGLYRRALAIDERAFAPGHPRVIAGLHNRAGILVSIRRYAEAEELLRRGLTADEKTYGPSHLEIAPALKLLATVVSQREEFTEAETLLRRALEIDETALGSDHSEVAADLASLGSLLLTLGQLTEARQLTLRSVHIYLRLGKRLRREHPHLPSALQLLADIERAGGRGDQEIADQERELLGVESPHRERPVISPARHRMPRASL